MAEGRGGQKGEEGGSLSKGKRRGSMGPMPSVPELSRVGVEVRGRNI